MRPLPIPGIALLFIVSMHSSALGSIAENCRRFGTIVIHNVNFQKSSPEDTITFLNMNWKNTDPQVEGMDLKLAPGGFAGKTVTLTARDMNLSELVGRVAEQLNAVVIIQSDSILLKPNNGEQAAPSNGDKPSN